MSLTASELRDTVIQIVENGTIVRFRFFNRIFNSGSYDDDIVLNQSGNDLFTSGLIFPISSSDSLLVERGVLLEDDQKLYIAGNIETSGLFKVGISGTIVTNDYQVVDEGIKHLKIKDDGVYKKLFIRRLTTGSILGESS